jgi:arylsulfatase A-like enzyme
MLRPLLLLLVSAACCLPAPAGAGARPPNILLVLTDDMRRDDLAQMPVVQELLIRQGTTFSAFVANVPLCCPARATILRGQYSHNTGVLTNQGPRGGFARFHGSGAEQQTVATALHAAGYATGLFGKYMNGYPGKAGALYVPPGWSDWASPISGEPYRGYDYAVLQRNDLSDLFGLPFFPVFYGRDRDDYATDVFVARTREFLEASVRAGTPFFAVLATHAPHEPAPPAPRHAHLLPDLGVPRGPSFGELDLSDKPAYIRRLRALGPGAQRRLERMHRQRTLSLQAVDEGVASLLATLHELGELPNTYVFFTSDNGYHLGEHRIQGGKRTPYEEDIGLPFVARGPGVPRGETIAALAGNTDLAPTFVAIAGTQLPYDPDGRSLLPWLSETGAPPAGRQAFLLSLWKGSNTGDRKMKVPTYHGLRTPGRLYVEYENGERELYDLERDPLQLDNEYAAARGALVEALAGRLAALRGCRGRTCRELEDLPLP